MANDNLSVKYSNNANSQFTVNVYINVIHINSYLIKESA